MAAVRTVIFAQMVDDPSSVPEEFPTAEAQDRERERLFRLLEELVKWENTANEELLEAARREIPAGWPRRRRPGHGPEPASAPDERGWRVARVAPGRGVVPGRG